MIKDLTMKLISFKTFNMQELRECSNFIKDFLTENGFSAIIKEYDSGYPVVISESNKKIDRQIMFNGHYDVVPPGEGWDFDPFSPKEVEGKIYGRGSTDMKGGLAVLMQLYVDLAEKLEELGYSLIFTAVPDEETGGVHGSKHLAEEYSPSLVIIGEPTGWNRVNIGEKGLFQIKVIEKGKTAHGSTPSLGENAIIKLVDDLVSLETIQEYPVKIPKEVIKAIDEVKKINPAIYNDLKRISYNPGKINGGIKINVVPEYAEAEVDIRVPPGITTEEVKQLISELVEGEVQIINSSEPNYSILPSSMKFESQIISPYATDGRYFRLKGIPTIVYGPGELNMLHAKNEFVRVEDLMKSYEILKNNILNFVNSKK
ncbi:ArgE/DapE family deacylase [Acidianus sulfidivorans JP7]|uniref:Probable succinyl-diaminopimelate desuccinylase n=1 Tax=Acidianus sulfidivorans JP7 TaxID=619593 RepID=A0A2U9IL02_9CREN|nr:M20 family metallopeptidase [Acidianus sulfidivorans]AWR96728.1 ArgE/DapE family deacylase [Acidianus sulfidivorans JP7]